MWSSKLLLVFVSIPSRLSPAGLDCLAILGSLQTVHITEARNMHVDRSVQRQGYAQDGRGVGVRFPVEGRDFCIPVTSEEVLGPVQWVRGSVVPRVKLTSGRPTTHTRLFTSSPPPPRHHVLSRRGALLCLCYKSKTKAPWPQSASKLYRPSDRSLSAKLVPT
jgi:hypothetical protein